MSLFMHDHISFLLLHDEKNKNKIHPADKTVNSAKIPGAPFTNMV